MENTEIPDKIPILPLVNDVLLPGAVLKINIANAYEKAVIHHVLTDGLKVIGIIPRKSDLDENIKVGDIGTAAVLLRISSTHVPQRSSFIMIFGLKRFMVKAVTLVGTLKTAEIKLHQDSYDNLGEETIAVLESMKKIVVPLIHKAGFLPLPYFQYFKKMVDKLPSPVFIDVFLSVIPSSFEEKLHLLNTLDISERISKGIPMIMRSLGLDLNVDELKKIAEKSMPGNGITFFRILKPSVNVKDLPDHEDKELSELQRKLQNANLPDYASKIVMKELARLKRTSHFSPDHPVVRNYLEFVAELPWSVSSKDTLDVNVARVELNIDHYGMEKVKKRILEYLAVCQLKPDLKGPIICFVGPPGVGKTSIGRSIARILSKKFQRISLGGVSNQSEIRGHRRTYVGALPGRILQALRNAGTNNPVILLDEIDKLGTGVLGDPKAALLEVLDPEQNSHFTDHYLGMPFDLSNVTFIATANSAKTIPLPLYDRMEVIHVSGYTLNEKFHIASRHLLPKQIDLHGLNSNILQISDEALNTIIIEYTREAGVRALERKLAAVCRSIALKVADSSCESLPAIIEKEDLEEILGMPLYIDDEIAKIPHKPGVAVGLAWTAAGGTILLIEVTRLPGKGQLILTGCLGGVMKESARIALNWVRSTGQQYGIMDQSCDMMTDSDLHIHFPHGAVSKDGPSAGVTIACAILSYFTGVPISSGLAMTGEITLQGIVLPVGGIKEKLSAAHRMGIQKVIIPFKSKKDLSDLSETILASLEIVLVENMTEVIEAAFDGSLIARPNESLLCSKL